MRGIIIAMGTLVVLGAIAGPTALAAVTGFEVPEVTGTAAAVWCGPDENNCCGEPIRVLKYEVQNPIQC